MSASPENKLPTATLEAMILFGAVDHSVTGSVAAHPPSTYSEIAAEAKKLAVNGMTVEVSINDLRADATLTDAVSSADRPPAMVVAIRGDDPEALIAAGRCVVEITETLSAEASHSVLGAYRYQILEGFGPVKIFYGLRRLPHMDGEAFRDYWINTHADVGRVLIPPYSYIQSHTDAAFTARLSEALGLAPSDLDGVATVHFPDEAACDRQLARQDVADIAIEDEKHFIDHERVVFAIMACTQNNQFLGQ